MTRAEQAAAQRYGLREVTPENIKLRSEFIQGCQQAERDIKERLLELIEEEEKFWDDGEMIFRGLKNKLNEI